MAFIICQKWKDALFEERDHVLDTVASLVDDEVAE